MRYHNFIALALFNVCFLTVLGFGLSSCNRGQIPKSGLFTHYYKEFERLPAAVVKSLDFATFQDPQQIYIHCQKRTLDPKKCYSEHLKASVKRFSLEYKKDLDTDALQEEYSYQRVHEVVSNKTQTMLGELSKKLDKIVDARVKFCEQNSTIDFKRCLLKYHKSESLEALNHFQSSYPRLNGHEYLYLQTKITEVVKERLLALHDALKQG